MRASELTHHMLALKLSQSDLARLLPMSLSAVARMCRGEAPVNPIVARLVHLWVVDPTAFNAQVKFCKMRDALAK